MSDGKHLGDSQVSHRHASLTVLLFSACQFAGTLSDGLGKTMDNRHQSEREYIRYHGATSGEHLVAGIHGLAHGTIWKYFIFSDLVAKTTVQAVFLFTLEAS